MPPARNKPARIGPRARRDLDDIWDYSAETWSPDQADRYVAGLADAIVRIAQNPNLAPERDEFAPPVRIYRCASHLIVYRVEADEVFIIRVRHIREDWMSNPEGG